MALSRFLAGINRRLSLPLFERPILDSIGYLGVLLVTALEAVEVFSEDVFVEIEIATASGTNLEFNHLEHHPDRGKNLLKFYLHRIIDFDTIRIKSYHMDWHNCPVEYYGRAFGASIIRQAWTRWPAVINNTGETP